MAGIHIPQPVKTPVQILTIKQMKELMTLPDLDTARGIRDRTMLELFYSCAFRLHEITTLTPDNFTEDYRRVKVRGKGSKDAVLPVGRMAAHFTRFYTEKIYPVLNRHSTDKLFLSVTTAAPLDKHVVYNSLRTYLKQIVPDRNIGTHIFRYSICTHLSEAGVDIRLLQEFMRHEKISTTARYIKRTFSRLQDTHKQTHPRS
jgi:integrase/recombinase XerD